MTDLDVTAIDIYTTPEPTKDNEVVLDPNEAVVDEVKVDDSHKELEEALKKELQSTDALISMIVRYHEDKSDNTAKPPVIVDKTNLTSVKNQHKSSKEPVRYHLPEIITVDNITKYLQTPETELKRGSKRLDIKTKLMVSLMGEFLGLFKTFESSREKQIGSVVTAFTTLANFTDVLHYQPKFAMAIKAKFDQFIMVSKILELIPLYNKIFNDKMYDDMNYVKAADSFALSDKDVLELTKKYNHDVAERIKQQKSLRVAPKFEENEIVGAKDKEGKWWMSRVLKVYEHPAFPNQSVYYVEYLGWGSAFNDFITNSYCIARYNPRAHIYYRPAWRQQAIEKEEAEVNKLITEIESKNE
jgi:hypothetical protein